LFSIWGSGLSPYSPSSPKAATTAKICSISARQAILPLRHPVSPVSTALAMVVVAEGLPKDSRVVEGTAVHRLLYPGQFPFRAQA
jgi:hypothetical protein